MGLICRTLSTCEICFENTQKKKKEHLENLRVGKLILKYIHNTESCSTSFCMCTHV
jgi:hypothetical protein